MVEITQALVRQHFSYNPETGELLRNGQPVGTPHGTGYLCLSFMGKRLLAHRLIWFYMTGQWPNTIDHKNRHRADNRWENLQDVTTSENSQRSKAPRGPKGEKHFYTKLLDDVKVSRELALHNAPAGRVKQVS